MPAARPLEALLRGLLRRIDRLGVNRLHALDVAAEAEPHGRQHLFAEGLGLTGSRLSRLALPPAAVVPIETARSTANRCR